MVYDTYSEDFLRFFFSANDEQRRADVMQTLFTLIGFPEDHRPDPQLVIDAIKEVVVKTSSASIPPRQIQDFKNCGEFSDALDDAEYRCLCSDPVIRIPAELERVALLEFAESKAKLDPEFFRVNDESDD